MIGERGHHAEEWTSIRVDVLPEIVALCGDQKARFRERRDRLQEELNAERLLSRTLAPGGLAADPLAHQASGIAGL